MDPARTLPTLRKRRGVVQGSITRLANTLKDLEATPIGPGVGDSARQSATKLETLDKEFKSLYFEIVDLINDKEVGELNKEQEVLDRHDDDIEAIAIRHQQLITKYGNPTDTTGARKSSSQKLSRLEQCFNSADEEIATVRDGRSKVPLLEQYREQLIDHKRKLTAVYEDLTALNLDDGDDLVVLHVKLEKLLFSCSLHIKVLLRSDPATTPTVTNKGVKLPKLNVPAFDGDVLHWK